MKIAYFISMKRILLLQIYAVLLILPVFAGQPAFDFTSLPKGHAAAVFAGGCFWCMEKPYDSLEGVIKTLSGYTGGHAVDPTYRQVTRGGTGHLEALLVIYDPKKVTYEKLLDVFWVNIDPTDARGQFCDRGESYTTGIFFFTPEQKRKAENSKNILVTSKQLSAKIVTPIISATEFYIAEEYHQDYYLKNPIRYRTYRNGCGRDARLRQLWGAKAIR